MKYALEGDLLTIRANWLAISCFGRERYQGKTDLERDGFPLSARTVALLFADIDWLMTLWDDDV